MDGTNYSLSDIASVAGGENGAFGGSSALVLILLFAMIFGFGGGGFGGNTANAVSQADLQRAIDLNSIQTGQAGISADIQRTTYETMGTVKDAAYNNLSETRDLQSTVASGNANIINQLTAMQANQQNCCCETKQAIMENRYLDAQNAAAIQATDTANTQKVLDAIATNRMADMQNQINSLQLQLATANTVKYPTISAYCSGSNPYGSCSCGNL